MDIMTIVLFVVGLVLLVAGAEVLVRGASKLALVAGVSPLVIGLTIVAFGTSSPEMAVSMQSALVGQADIAIGNVVGSNIFNVLLILGLCALLLPLVVEQRLVRLDVPLMILASFVLLALSWDGTLSRLDGLLLFAGIIAYTGFTLLGSRTESEEVEEQYEEAFGEDEVKGAGGREIGVQLVLIVVGLGMLVLGSRWLLEGAVAIARAVGLSELIIGLTIVSVGTSLPEVATSLLATLRGERDIAVGNVIGSNIFNILAVLGLAGLLSPHPIAVADSALRSDIPIMIAVAVACLPVFLTGIISRPIGALFVAHYIAYTTYLVLGGTNSPLLPGFIQFMIVVAMPLTVLLLGFSTFRGLRTATSPLQTE